MSDAARRFVRGAGWLYAYRWLDRALEFVALVVLARILSPDDFGLVAIAASFVTIVEGLAALDVGKALIRSRDDDRELFDTAWTLAAIRGLVSGLVMLAIAPFLGDARISTVLVVLAASPVLTGLQNPRFVAFERDLLYSKLAALTLGARLGSFVVTVGVAVAIRSYWALVVGLLTASVVSLVLSYLLRPYRPRISLVRFREIFAFSGWLSLTTLVTTLAMETDRLIVGKLVGDADLYFMTQRVGVLPTRELVSPLQRILFPSFSGLVDDPARLRRAVLESVNVLGSLSLPAGCGFALVAGDFVPLALGQRWMPIVPLLAVLTPYLGLRATLSQTLPCVMALGRTRLLFGVSLAYALVHLPVFVTGTALYALPGAIGSIVVAGVVYTALNAWMLWRTVGIRPGEIVAQLGRPLAATAVMVAAVLALREILPSPVASELRRWLTLGAEVGLGGAGYAVALGVLWRWRGRPPGIESRFLQLLGR